LIQLDEEMASLVVNWVPRKLAPNIRCVFTMIEDTPQHKALIQREPQPFLLQLAPLTDINRQVMNIICLYFARYGSTENLNYLTRLN